MFLGGIDDSSWRHPLTWHRAYCVLTINGTNKPITENIYFDNGLVIRLNVWREGFFLKKGNETKSKYFLHEYFVMMCYRLKKQQTAAFSKIIPYR